MRVTKKPSMTAVVTYVSTSVTEDEEIKKFFEELDKIPNCQHII